MHVRTTAAPGARTAGTTGALRPERSGQEQCLAIAERRHVPPVPDLGRAPKPDQDREPFGAADGDGYGIMPRPGSESRAVEPEPLEGEKYGRTGPIVPLPGGATAGDRLWDGFATGSDGPGVEVGRFQGLGRMELPRLAVGPDAAPVVDAEGGVGHLLDLRQHDPGADRVDRPGRDHHAVPRAGLEPMEQRLDAVPERMGEVAPPCLSARARSSRATPGSSPA